MDFVADMFSPVFVSLVMYVMMYCFDVYKWAT